jgi:hypothetical protein
VNGHETSALQEELQADHGAPARDIFSILNWAFLESGIVEGGSGSCDVDILHLAGIAEREERSTVNKDEAVREILREEGHCGVKSFKMMDVSRKVVLQMQKPPQVSNVTWHAQRPAIADGHLWQSFNMLWSNKCLLLLAMGFEQAIQSS